MDVSPYMSETAERDLQTRLEILRIQQEIAALDTNLARVMTVLVERACVLANAKGGALDLVEADELVCHASSGAQSLPVGTRLGMQSSLAGIVVHTRETLVCDDVHSDLRSDQFATQQTGARSVVAVPVLVDDDVIAVLVLWSTQPRAFSARDVANLQILVETLGATIKRHRIAMQLQSSEQQYRLLFAMNPQPMWVYEPENFRILAVNRAMVEHYGYTEAELLSMTMRDVWFSPITRSEEILRQKQSAFESFNIRRRHRKKDGTSIDVDISSCPIMFDGVDARLVSASDVTLRLRAEEELARVSRAQRMLSTCNEVLIRANLQQNLLEEICRVAVEIGGYCGAFVGFARDDASQSIELLASAGVVPEAPPRDALPSWSELTVRGRGPAGRAVRSGQAIFLRDIRLEVDSALPRKDALLAVGIRGLICLPLREGQRTFGVLYLFAAEVVEFSSDEIMLLQQLADDLAFGIANLRVQATVRNQAALLDKAQDAIIVRAMNGRVLFWNRSAERLYGWTSEEALGKILLEPLYGDAITFFAAQQQLEMDGTWSGEFSLRRKDRGSLVVESRWTLLRDDHDLPQSVLEINTDISERKKAEHEIQRLAFYDTLTQLPNRLLLMDRLEHALAGCARTGRCGALLFIDLDNFKALNDTLGHYTGDMLLQQVARRLSECVRDADTVARFGGDEFAVVLEDLSGMEADAGATARIVAEKLLAAMARPYLLGSYQYNGSSSIGVAPFGLQHPDANELLKQADLAMYQAKTAGRNAVRFFDPAMQSLVNARVQMELEMRQALDKGEFDVHYQLQFNDTGHATGAEALLRWHRPGGGSVSPAEFIPLAEETGIIVPLGQWVLCTACAQLRMWQEDPRTKHLTMAVNVSARQFRGAEFVSHVRAALQTAGVDGRQLKLELTESMLVSDLEQTIGKMTELKAQGICFSLDDFGTGYSSLSYLKRLPLDQLKIDQSFVRDIHSDVNGASIVRTIIALGRSLGLGVIAEGVETAMQRDFLAMHGCLEYQGYLFTRPLPADALVEFLRSNSYRT